MARDLLQYQHGSRTIRVRRYWNRTELRIDDSVADEKRGIIEARYTLCAKIGDDEILVEMLPQSTGGSMNLKINGVLVTSAWRSH